MAGEALDLRVKVFADGADISEISRLAADPLIRGFTTNPTLMRASGIRDYEAFAKEVVSVIPNHSLSLEVFSDEFDEMERQARDIAAWGKNVFVKIPVTNTRAEPSTPLIRRLAQAGIQLNITAMLTLEQVREVSKALAGGPASYISLFAGRVADTGVDPLPMMTEALQIMRPHPQQQLIWASPRELLNVIQADQIGCHVITVTNDILKKLNLLGKDLTEYSLETVNMFESDARAAGYKL